MKKNLLAAITTLLVAVMLVGCSQVSNVISNEKASTNAATEMEKFNAYIDLSNYMSGWLETNLYGYSETFGFGEELEYVKRNFDPATFDGLVITPIIEGFFEQVDQAVAYSDQEPSYNAADETMKELGPKLKQLMTTINDIQTYYSSKGFVEDDYAKGKELHRSLYTQYFDYLETAEQFFTNFTVITNEKDIESLEKLKEEGYFITYYAKSIVVKAKAIQNSFIDAEVGDDNILDFDTEEYRAQYTALSEDIDQFLEYAQDAEQKQKEGITTLWRFDEVVPNVKAAATSIMQVLDAQSTDLETPASGKVLTGDLIGYLESYDRAVSTMISSFNNMISVGR